MIKNFKIAFNLEALNEKVGGETYKIHIQSKFKINHSKISVRLDKYRLTSLYEQDKKHNY